MCLDILAGGLETRGPVAAVAIWFVRGVSAAAQGNPLPLGNGVAVSFLVHNLYGAYDAVGAVCSYFDLDVGHFLLLHIKDVTGERSHDHRLRRRRKSGNRG